MTNMINTMLDVANNGKSISPPAGYKSIKLTTEGGSVVKTSVETLLCQSASHINNCPLSKVYRIVFVHDEHRTPESSFTVTENIMQRNSKLKCLRPSKEII